MTTNTCAVFVYSLQDHPNATGGGGGGGRAWRGRVDFSSLTSLPPRPYTAASSTSLLHEPSRPLASRRASGPRLPSIKNACRSRRPIVFAREPRKTHCERPGAESVRLTCVFPVFAGLPRAQERRRVPAQHKGVPQGLHIIPRRGKRPFFPLPISP